jgi:ubiquinone/menaquinone biosynthesis C-methylase UbiE
MGDVASSKDEDRAEWDRTAAGWARWTSVIEPGFARLNAELLRLAGIGPGISVLDLATGIGEPALTAASLVAPGGRVVGIDLSPQMLRLACERAAAAGIANAAFRELDIDELASLEMRFDAALCRFGLMFVPEVSAALRTIRSVIRDGGRFAAAVWATPAEVPLISLPREALATALAAAMERAGFGAIEITRVNAEIHFASAEQYAQAITEIAASLIELIESGKLERDQVVTAIAAEAAARFGDGAIAVPAFAHCLGATATP